MGLLSNRPFTGGNFEFLLDGEQTGAYIKSIDGGLPSTSVMDEPVGSDLYHVKHAAVVDVEPMTIEFGMSSARSLLIWIRDSWLKDWKRHSGEVIHADSTYNQALSHEFMDALILETTFPTLDGSSTEGGYMKVQIQPERVKLAKTPGPQLNPGKTGTQKMWMPSMFRLTIQGVDGLQYCNRIESFAIKQTVKKLHVGRFRQHQLVPVRLEFPSLSGSIAMAYAGNLIDWYNRYVNQGAADPGQQKDGTLELLSPTGSTLLTIHLKKCGINKLVLPRREANTSDISRVKFDMYVNSMSLELGPDLEYDSSDSMAARFAASIKRIL